MKLIMILQEKYISKIPSLLVFLYAILFVAIPAAGQDRPIKKIDPFLFNDKLAEHFQKIYGGLQKSVEKQSAKMLQRMQKKEANLQNKLKEEDSSKDAELFTSNVTLQYQNFQNKLNDTSGSADKIIAKEYIPGIDSLATTLNFYLMLAGNSMDSKGDEYIQMSPGKLVQLQELSVKVQDMQCRMQQALNIQDFIRQREALLKERLANTGLNKQLTRLNKEVVYYQQRVNNYKTLLNNKKTLKEKLLSSVRSVPAFQKFWQHNSMLAELFPAPTEGSNSAVALAGLQTRASIGRLLNQGFVQPASSAAANTSILQQQLREAQTKLNSLKDKLSPSVENGETGNSDITQPDFKPNSQKTKGFLKRIRYGLNIQSQPGSNFFPATSDIAFILAYKLSDKATAGLGLSYKMGWGDGWKYIKLTNEGLGLRTYVDIKAKGNFWLSGGFEYNYLQNFKTVQEIYNSYKLPISPWQKSGLIGVCKKIQLASPVKKNKKSKETSIQGLYDFMHNQHYPPSPAFKFRVGWSF